MTRVPQTLAQLQALPAPRPTTVVEFLEDQPRFKISQGDQFEACPYVLDPGSKWTLFARLSDGFDPMCSAYQSQVKIVRQL